MYSERAPWRPFRAISYVWSANVWQVEMMEVALSSAALDRVTHMQTDELSRGRWDVAASQHSVKSFTAYPVTSTTDLPKKGRHVSRLERPMSYIMATCSYRPVFDQLHVCPKVPSVYSRERWQPRLVAAPDVTYSTDNFWCAPRVISRIFRSAANEMWRQVCCSSSESRRLADADATRKSKHRWRRMCA